ncbi:MAG: hypothetical protein QXO54_06025 [Candidatus Methanomethylicaceae archaeon]
MFSPVFFLASHHILLTEASECGKSLLLFFLIFKYSSSASSAS